MHLLRPMSVQFLLCFLMLLVSPAPSSAAGLIDVQSSAAAGLGNIDFLPVEQAFVLQTSAVSGSGITLQWVIEPGYYLYRDRFHISLHRGHEAEVLAPVFDTAGELKFDEVFGREVEVYHGQALLRIPAPLIGGAVDGALLEIESQGCADAGLCYPPRKQWFRVAGELAGLQSVDAPAPQSSPIAVSATSSALEGVPSTLSWPVALLFALLGGLILNLMPCVFPILSIKVLSFAASSDAPHTLRWHGLLYTLGVVLSFLCIAGVMLLLRAGGEAAGWGFQLQSPIFITSLVLLFFLMGLNLSGYFSMGESLMGAGHALSTRSDAVGSFFTGVLAVVVATPCTAPFMAPALGWALTQPTSAALAVFACLGAGLALPFLVLANMPSLLHRLPRPGVWMENFRQFLAFPMYLSAVWLLWVLGHQAGSNAVASAVLCGVLLAMAIWCWRHGLIGRTVAVICVLLGVLLVQSTKPTAGSNEQAMSERFTEERLAQLHSAGEPVLVNITADWCITCLANERMAIGTNATQQLMAEQGVHYLKGDWTNGDPALTAFLARQGRSGVPLYLFYPRGQNSTPKVLSQILMESELIKIISDE